MVSYKIHGPWAIDEVYVNDEHDIKLTLMVTDLIDHHGNVFRDGAWQVKDHGKVVKTFKGETAWSDALRLFGDLRFAALRNTY
jgi:hypothetical protein